MHDSHGKGHTPLAMPRSHVHWVNPSFKQVVCMLLYVSACMYLCVCIYVCMWDDVGHVSFNCLAHMDSTMSMKLFPSAWQCLSNL